MEVIIGSVVVCSSVGCAGISELLIESLVLLVLLGLLGLLGLSVLLVLSVLLGLLELLEGFVTLVELLPPNILLSGSRTREECSSEEDNDVLKLPR